MRQHAGYRIGDQLVGLGTHGDRWRNAYEDQQGRHHEAAANPEHAREKTHAGTKHQQHGGIDRYFSDGQIDLHLGIGIRCGSAVQIAENNHDSDVFNV